MLAQIIRVISSPSKSTTGLATLILEALASVERKLAILLYYVNKIKEKELLQFRWNATEDSCKKLFC